ncbi:hypothetical protein [Phaeacidiphilus oryzae]|uniref:hypothetical protein n=1 Tax=Phaeacidiphilus oryzae TaxID=348818 RepID=UPI0012699E84|nr:hypothetical protein [Phaeacidiphilus oryzae]
MDENMYDRVSRLSDLLNEMQALLAQMDKGSQYPPETTVKLGETLDLVSVKLARELESLRQYLSEFDAYDARAQQFADRNGNDVVGIYSLPGDGFIAAIANREENFDFLFGEKMEEKPPGPEIPSSISVAIYLDTDDTTVSERIVEKVDKLVESMGYVQTGEVDTEPGSIWRSWRARMVREELATRMVKVERALELTYVESRQAEADSKEAQAVGGIIGALVSVPRAAVRAGSILVLKFPIQGETAIFVRNLSQMEIRALEKFPEIQRSPERVLESLALAIASHPELKAGDGDSL